MNVDFRSLLESDWAFDLGLSDVAAVLAHLDTVEPDYMEHSALAVDHIAVGWAAVDSTTDSLHHGIVQPAVVAACVVILEESVGPHTVAVGLVMVVAVGLVMAAVDHASMMVPVARGNLAMVADLDPAKVDDLDPVMADEIAAQLGANIAVDLNAILAAGQARVRAAVPVIAEIVVGHVEHSVAVDTDSFELGDIVSRANYSVVAPQLVAAVYTVAVVVVYSID